MHVLTFPTMPEAKISVYISVTGTTTGSGSLSGPQRSWLLLLYEWNQNKKTIAITKRSGVDRTGVSAIDVRKFNRSERANDASVWFSARVRRTKLLSSNGAENITNTHGGGKCNVTRELKTVDLVSVLTKKPYTFWIIEIAWKISDFYFCCWFFFSLRYRFAMYI